MSAPVDVRPARPTASPPRRSARRARRVLLVAGIVAAAILVLLVLFAAVALRRLEQPATVPAGFRPATALPRSTEPLGAGVVAFDSDRSGSFQIHVLGPDGSDRALTTDPMVDSWWPRVSPDRRTILFYRVPAGTHDRDFTVTDLWAMGADGSNPVLLRPAGLDGWVQQGHAEWSPDGRSLVMFGGSRLSPQLHVTDALGRAPRAITDRPGVNLDPAFTPDGTSVVFVGCPSAMCTPGSYEIYRIPTAGGDAVRLTFDDLRDQDPYVAPDGSRLAWLTQVEGGVVGTWDIRIAGPDGADPRRLVDRPGISSKPEWSRDGSMIWFHRLEPGTTEFQLFTIRPDGTGLEPRTVGHPGVNEYPGT